MELKSLSSGSNLDKESAIRWARRHGFVESKISEFKAMLAIIESTYINRKELESAVYLDKGAFGAIDQAYYHGTVSACPDPFHACLDSPWLCHRVLF